MRILALCAIVALTFAVLSARHTQKEMIIAPQVVEKPVAPAAPAEEKKTGDLDRFQEKFVNEHLREPFLDLFKGRFSHLIVNIAHEKLVIGFREKYHNDERPQLYMSSEKDAENPKKLLIASEIRNGAPQIKFSVPALQDFYMTLVIEHMGNELKAGDDLVELTMSLYIEELQKLLYGNKKP